MGSSKITAGQSIAVQEGTIPQEGKLIRKLFKIKIRLIVEIADVEFGFFIISSSTVSEAVFDNSL